MNNTTLDKKNATGCIQWLTQFEYDDAVALSRQTGRPILIDLHSESAKGCQVLEEAIYSDPVVIEKVMRHCIPVRIHVDTKEPNPITSAIVGSHIFIWSQTVQLIAPDGDIYHKFLGTPRHTRLDMGYTRVHHDVDGRITVPEFLAQLQLGLGKEALFRGNFAAARDRLAKVDGSAIACEEAAYWMTAAENEGVHPRTRRATKAKAPLARAVERFCEALVQIPDSELMLDWHGKKAPGDWSHYTDCLREVVFGTYQRMLDLAHKATGEREATGRAQTLAQRMLRTHQVAYRELWGLIVGLDTAELDQIHLRENRSLGKQRSIRNNLVHCVMAEWWAHTPAIRATLRTIREGVPMQPLPADETIARFGEPPANYGDIGDLIEKSELMHRALIDEFHGMTDDEVNACAAWWEGSPVSIRFRLGRFGWHLHDHAMVIETILERIGRKRSETERLARFVYRALGELEGALIGMTTQDQARYLEEVTLAIDDRAEELEKLADRFAVKAAN